MYVKTISACLLLLSMAAQAKVRLPQLLSDHAVLQQQTQVRLWGEATPDSDVVIQASWSQQPVTVKAGSDGTWETTIATPSASYTPHTLTLRDNEPGVTLHDLLIGEVWFCSGQSNMEMPLNGFISCPIDGANAVIADAPNHPGIRMATIARKSALTPQPYADGAWLAPTTGNAPTFSATGYFYALALERTLQVPIGIINCSWGGSSVEGWTPEEILKGYPDIDLARAREKERLWEHPMIMYNGMLYPCRNYTIKGFIWYQGCANVGRADTYAERQATMVRQWRTLWRQGELPFYYVEIAPFRYSGEEHTEAALLREAQFASLALIPNAGMVSTNDLVQPFEAPQIHPANKRDIGERLAWQALAKSYGYPGIVADSPSFREMRIEQGKAILSFDNAAEGFSPWMGIDGFEIAGKDRRFRPAQAKLGPKPNEITVSADQVKTPAAVRYCFRNFRVGNLKNHRGLPVIPFRTDRW